MWITPEGRALGKLVRGLADLGEAAIAWEQAADLFRAAARPRRLAPPDLAVDRSAAPAQDPAGASPARAEERRGEDLVIEARGLTHRYGERSEPAVAECDLAIPHGDRVLLQGPSGGGKSTLASLLVGLREPQRVYCFLAGLSAGRSARVGGGGPSRRRSSRTTTCWPTPSASIC